jgi:hypothetical protein
MYCVYGCIFPVGPQTAWRRRRRPARGGTLAGDCGAHGSRGPSSPILEQSGAGRQGGVAAAFPRKSADGETKRKKTKRQMIDFVKTTILQPIEVGLGVL